MNEGALAAGSVDAVCSDQIAEIACGPGGPYVFASISRSVETSSIDSANSFFSLAFSSSSPLQTLRVRDFHAAVF
jgi:hypothetical protein